MISNAGGAIRGVCGVVMAGTPGNEGGPGCPLHPGPPGSCCRGGRWVCPLRLPQPEVERGHQVGGFAEEVLPQGGEPAAGEPRQDPEILPEDVADLADELRTDE